MGFSKDDVIYMAKMAKLRFTDEEAEKLAEEIAMVLSVIGKWKAMIRQMRQSAGERACQGRPGRSSGRMKSLFSKTGKSFLQIQNQCAERSYRFRRSLSSREAM